MAGNQVLLVEGKNDHHLIKNLLAVHKIENLTIRPKNGLDLLCSDLPTELKASELLSLGVVVDSDQTPSSRWDSLRHALSAAGYTNVPPAPDQIGTIVQQADYPRVGIWLMPDNRTTGKLEDFVRMLVPSNDQLWIRAEQCVESIPNSLRRFRPVDLPKVYVHTWLAWQEEPGYPMGAAVTRKYLDCDSPQAQAFVNWVRRLTA
jgi:hypothetical protein